MIPVMQTVVGDGQDGRPNGDCLRACVASIFELPIEEVPHFVDINPPSGWLTALQEWLRPFGLALMDRQYKKPCDVPEFWPSGWWIASVESENFPGLRHAIVMFGIDDAPPGEDWYRQIGHDPSPRPRRTPYVFRGASWFVARDPAVIARAVLR